MTRAGRYYRITPRFWQDSDVRNDWTEDMRMLALYLMTSPHRNMIGLFYCPLNYMESDLQWTSKRLQSAFEALAKESVDFVRYDPKAHVVFLVNGLKHDAPSSGNQVEGASTVVAGLPTTYLLNDLLEAADSLCPELAKRLRSDFEATSEHLRIPYPYSVPRTPYPDTEIKDLCVSGETHDSVPADAAEPTKQPHNRHEYTAEFEEFWTIYPRKKEKANALKAWTARLKDREEPAATEQLILAARNYAEECRAKGRALEYTKLPATFLGPGKPYLDYLVAPATPKPSETTISLSEARKRGLLSDK